jgi:hypothetical protein
MDPALSIGKTQVNWTPFYQVMAEASATVMALLFVAVQLSAAKVSEHRSARWWSIAFSTFYLYLTAFFVPLWFLIPSMGPYSRPMLAFILASIGIVRTVRGSLFVWRGTARNPEEQWWQRTWYIAGPLILYGFLAYYAARSYFASTEIAEEKNVAIVLVLIFSLALKNSWSLLVEGVFAGKA